MYSSRNEAAAPDCACDAEREPSKVATPEAHVDAVSVGLRFFEENYDFVWHITILFVTRQLAH